MKKYMVKDWDINFENNRSRKMVNMMWVPVPNKHDGEGFAYIMSLKDGMALYGAWHLILQVASKCHPRGTLVRDNGEPHTAASIAMKTRGCAKIIEKALAVCSSPEVCWLQEVSLGDTIVPPSCHPADEEEKGREENEENGIEGTDDNSIRLTKDQIKIIIDTWNNAIIGTPLSKINTWGSERSKHYKARLKAFDGDHDKLWIAVIEQLSNLGDFAKGKNDTAWMVSFDWIMKSEGNFNKFVEGNYRYRGTHR